MSTTLYDRLAEVRQSSGLPLAAFAERLTEGGYKISHGGVKNYENEESGSEKVPTAYAVAVCHTFGWSVAWLVAGEGLPHVPATEDALRLKAVAKIIDGSFDEHELRVLLTPPLPGAAVSRLAGDALELAKTDDPLTADTPDQPNEPQGPPPEDAGRQAGT
jgi:transcriptional regulator with XRE-family HTH domain